MASARRLYRLNMAVAGLGALVVLAILGAALSRLSLTPPPVEDVLAACGRLMPAGLSPAGALLLGLGGLALIVFVRGLRSVLTEARAQLRVRSGLRAAVEHELDGAFVRDCSRAAARRLSAPGSFVRASSCRPQRAIGSPKPSCGPSSLTRATTSAAATRCVCSSPGSSPTRCSSSRRCVG